MDYDEEDECLFNVLTFALRFLFMLSMSIFKVITNNNCRYIHGLCFHIKSQIRSGFELTSKAIQADVSLLGMYIFKDAICGRRRGVFVHITANLV